MQDLLNQMTNRVLRHTEGMRMETPLPHVGIGVLWPQSSPTLNGCGAGVCLVLQGGKEMIVGNRTLRYGAGSCFASLIELPTTKSTFQTDDGRPYVATSLKLDEALLISLLTELPQSAATKAAPSFSTAMVSPALLQSWDHYLALLDTPEDIPFLAAARERELLYRLIQSDHGPMLRQIVGEEGPLARIRRAIEWIRENFDRPIAVKALAEIAGMSVPSFNRHFRTATSTSPLQYQKTLRLQAARRFMASSPDATRAAFSVGYESASQFSREYARLFGLPPKRDSNGIRQRHGSVSDILI